MSLSEKEKVRLQAKRVKTLRYKATGLYLYHPATDSWIPAQCDDEGRLVIDPSDLDTRYLKASLIPELGENVWISSLLQAENMIANIDTIWSGDVVAIAFPLPMKCQFDRIGFKFQLPQTGEVRMALYKSNGKCWPAELMLETTSKTIVSMSSWVIDEILEKGLYFVAWQTTSNDSKHYYTDISLRPLLPHVGSGFELITGYPTVGYTQAYGAFPDPFPVKTDPDIWYDRWIYSCGLRLVKTL